MNQTLVNGLILTCFGAFLAGLGYCVSKVLSHDTTMSVIRAQIAAMQKDCARHQEWAALQSTAIARIDKAVAGMDSTVTSIDKRTQRIETKIDK